MIEELKELYTQGVNISKHLEVQRRSGLINISRSYVIELAYDLQYGSYIEEYFVEKRRYDLIGEWICRVLEDLGVKERLSTIENPIVADGRFAHEIRCKLAEVLGSKEQRDCFRLHQLLSSLSIGRDFTVFAKRSN